MNTLASFNQIAITPMLSNLDPDMARREIQLAQVFEALVIGSLIAECGVVPPAELEELKGSLREWVFQLESSAARPQDITEALYISHTELSHTMSRWFDSLPAILEGTLRRGDFWKLAALGLRTSNGALNSFGLKLLLHYRSFVQYDTSRQFEFFLRFSDESDWSKILNASVNVGPALSGDSDLASLLDGFLRLLAYFNDINQTFKSCKQLGLPRTLETQLKERLLDVHKWRLPLAIPRVVQRVEQIKQTAVDNLFNSNIIALQLGRSSFESQLEEILQEWLNPLMAR